jgi:hypothetical protein
MHDVPPRPELVLRRLLSLCCLGAPVCRVETEAQLATMEEAGLVVRAVSSNAYAHTFHHRQPVRQQQLAPTVPLAVPPSAASAFFGIVRGRHCSGRRSCTVCKEAPERTKTRTTPRNSMWRTASMPLMSSRQDGWSLTMCELNAARLRSSSFTSPRFAPLRRLCSRHVASPRHCSRSNGVGGWGLGWSHKGEGRPRAASGGCRPHTPSPPPRAPCQRWP